MCYGVFGCYAIHSVVDKVTENNASLFILFINFI